MSVSSQYLFNESLSSSGIGWYCSVRCKGAESWALGMSSASCFLYLVTMPCVLWHVPSKVDWQSSQGLLSVVLGHVYVVVVVQVIADKSNLSGNCCGEHSPLCR